MLHATTRRAIQMMEEDNLTPQEAAERSIAELKRLYDGNGGIIILDNNGQWGVCANTANMIYAAMSSRMKSPQVIVKNSKIE
jgi:isoaspartyl peptidase/L-asparaginase-like protein (Ntn-hydrolase superfamily)